MLNKVIILGCGPSAGVPIAGDAKGPKWGQCDATNSKNRRLRASIYVEFEGKRLLVDTAPDLRQQLLTYNLYDFDAILITHVHADHTHGINDLRPLFFKRGHSFPLYSNEASLTALQQAFSYLFVQSDAHSSYSKIFTPHVIESEFRIDNTVIQCIEQIHGKERSLGFRFNNLAYSTDFNDLDELAIEKLQGLDVWIVDCLSRSPKGTHNYLDLTLYWIDKVRPKRAILTHMGIELDYQTLLTELPDHITPAFDGMTFEF